MNRQLGALTGQRFDVVVLGGGILGACVARDAAMRGLSTALIDAGDFASGTSYNSLKVIHGGLRHLQHLDLPEVKASAYERSVWLRIAPHLVAPLPVLLPLFGAWPERWAYRAAVAMNDALTADRNDGLSPERILPRGSVVSRRECIERVPDLASTTVSGGILYYDAQAYSSERLVLAVIESAVDAGAVAVNHAACIRPLLESDRRVGVVVHDQLDDVEVEVRAQTIVNAAGPAAPALTARLLGRPARHPARFSLAWNLVLESTGHDVAFALPGEDPTPTASGGKRPRRLFFVPWRDRTLVGTGHASYEGHPADFTGMDPDHPALRAFIDETNRAWPGTHLGAEHVRLVHAGLLPAVPNDAVQVQLQRKHTVTVEADGGIPIVTATTVKLTAARRVAEAALDRTCHLLGHRNVSSTTATTLLPGAPGDGMVALARRAHHELGDRLESDIIDHLVSSYGTRYAEVLEETEAGADATAALRVAPDSPVVFGQLLRGLRHEMACTADDLLCRRTELGARGAISNELRARAESLFAQPTRGAAS